jgi:hypothetical protein
MKPKTIETIAWVLIYSGLLIAALGLFLRGVDALLGGLVIAAGLIDAVVGVALIVLRARMDKTRSKEML